MPWHRLGTVSVTQNSSTVTGVGTGFAANTRIGDAFIGPDGRQYELGNVASDTVISITPAYLGPTASGAAYAIVPVQGYQKGLSDQVRDWVNTYGSKMAALGTTGNYDILPLNKGGTGGSDQAGARTGLGLGAVATENIVPVVKGGTGGNSQATARTGLGLGSAAVAPLVGTVSQSGGAPTGAVFERGGSANGDWTKYADGTMICRGFKDLGNQAFYAAGNLFYAGAFSGIAFPQVFVGLAETHIDIISSGGLAWATQGSTLPGTTATGAFYVLNTSNIAVPLSAMWTAIGRWY